MAKFFDNFYMLSKSARESIAKLLPPLSLVLGILLLLTTWGLYGLARTPDKILNPYAVHLKPVDMSSTDRLIIYVSVVVVLVQAVVFLAAYPHLKKRARRGWDLLFIGLLLNVGYSVLAIFINGRGVGSFVLSLLGSVVGFYLLFQVRDLYGAVSIKNKE